MIRKYTSHRVVVAAGHSAIKLRVQPVPVPRHPWSYWALQGPPVPRKSAASSGVDMRKRFVPALAGISVLLALAAILNACGGSSTVCPLAGGCCVGAACAQPEFLYATATNKVLVFSVDRNSGVLTAKTPVNGPSDGTGLRATAGNSFVYVSDINAQNVDAFAVDATSGALTPISGSPFAGVSSPTGLVDNGKFLYVANLEDDTISGFTIAANGALIPLAGFPLATAPGPIAVAIDPTGKFLYVSNFHSGLGQISGYAIDASGGLTPVPGSPYTSVLSGGPQGLAIQSNSKFLYAALTNNGSVAGFTIDGTSGALTPIAGSPFPDAGQPNDVVIEPMEKFLYTCNGATGTVNGYSIDGTTGALTPLSSSPFPVGSGPLRMAVEFGRLYVTNSASNSISGFSMDGSSGALTALSGSPYAAGTQPIAIAIGH